VTSEQLLFADYDQILEDRIHLLDTVGEDYDEEKVMLWAWKQALELHPEFNPPVPEQAWLG
jgi:hypothetical protein